ncbi:MAG: hypothetical protein U1F43_15555 [Myxococcota bacterium]
MLELSTKVLVACLAGAAIAACAPSTPGGRPIIDVTDVFVPPDVLFPQDSGSDAATEIVDTGAAETVVATDATTTPDSTTPTDTTTAPDSTAATDTAVEPDTSTCPDGLGCDDHDLCTNNDHCEGGRCVGGGAVCDDHLPCTLDGCTAGVCDHSMQAGSCIIGGACWTTDQPNPEDACEHCDPTHDARDWTAIVGCGLGDPCSYQTDCYPERLCGLWTSTGQTVCSDPCSGAGDCPTGQICSKLPGSAQVGYCQDAVPGLVDDGGACSEDYQCRSGQCEGFCTPLCLDEAHCTTPGRTCHPIGDLALGIVTSACSPDPSGSIPLGQVCSPDGGNTFDGSFCASGHCDLTLYPDTNLPCSPICKSETDCAPAQECNLVLYGQKANPNVVPYDPQFTTATRDALTACYNPGQFGPKGVGAPCTDRSQCGSNKCLGLIPGDPTTYCTSFCEFDAECPSGMLCKLDVLNLASTWLATYPTISGQPPVNNAYTFVRICKFE